MTLGDPNNDKDEIPNSSDDVSPEPSLIEYAKENFDRVTRLMVVMTGDAIIFIAWLAFSFLLDKVGEFFERNGTHERVAFLLRHVSPWFFFSFAILNLLHDLVPRVKEVIHDIQQKPVNRK